MKYFSEYNILIIFIIIVILFTIVIVIYYFVLNPTKRSTNKIIEKYKTKNYTLPYYVAERYVVWNSMRGFFYSLHYIFTLLSIYASLMTVYYASNANDKSNYIIFLSLLSMCFTITNIFSNPIRNATMSQHIWRELDSCIITTINNLQLTDEEKDKILIHKITQLEKYIELYEL